MPRRRSLTSIAPGEERLLHVDPLWEGAVGVQLQIYRAQWNRAKVARTYRASP